MNRRKYLRYSLRTLLVIVTMISIACAIFAPRLYRARRQAAAISVITRKGGKIGYDFEVPVAPHPPGDGYPLPASDFMIRWVGIDFFADVDFLSFNFGSDFGDQNLSNVLALNGLREADICYSRLTEKSLDSFAKIRTLESLCVPRAFSPDAIQRFRKARPDVRVDNR
ncbi:MAG: hypothetical protein K8T25_15105 [Planctomycetia bacterium]|nr:hypothetical protein [Planctomycetia bacterium]